MPELRQTDLLLRFRRILAATKTKDDMSDVIERAKAVLEHRDTRIGHGLVSDLVAEVERLRWQIKHGGDHICDECWPEDDYGVLDDGFGNTWALCSAECKLEIVRPGKVQCDCDLT